MAEPVANAFAEHVPGFNCFGCAPGNHSGLKMKFIRVEAASADHQKFDAVRTEPFIVSADKCSFPGIVHGGVLSAVVDDCAYWCLYANTQSLALTTSLEIGFRRPAQTGKELVAEARLESFARAQSLAVVVVDIKAVGSESVLCTGKVKFHLPKDNAALRPMMGSLVDKLPPAKL